MIRNSNKWKEVMNLTHSVIHVVLHRKSVPYRAKLCRAKVTKFFQSDENFARRIVSPDKNFARQSFAQQDNQNLSK